MKQKKQNKSTHRFVEQTENEINVEAAAVQQVANVLPGKGVRGRGGSDLLMMMLLLLGWI